MNRGASIVALLALALGAWWVFFRRASTAPAPSGPLEKVNVLGNIGGLRYTNDKEALKDLSALLADSLQLATPPFKERFQTEAAKMCGPDWRTSNFACANSILGQLWSSTYNA